MLFSQTAVYFKKPKKYIPNYSKSDPISRVFRDSILVEAEQVHRQFVRDKRKRAYSSVRNSFDRDLGIGAFDFGVFRGSSIEGQRNRALTQRKIERKKDYLEKSQIVDVSIGSLCNDKANSQLSIHFKPPKQPFSTPKLRQMLKSKTQTQENEQKYLQNPYYKIMKKRIKKRDSLEKDLQSSTKNLKFKTEFIDPCSYISETDLITSNYSNFQLSAKFNIHTQNVNNNTNIGFKNIKKYFDEKYVMYRCQKKKRR